LSNSTTMHIFDCMTDTVSTVTLSSPVVGWSGHTNKGYDETKEAFISVSGSDVSWFKPDGTVTQGTRENFNYSDLVVVKNGYTIDSYYLRLGYTSAEIGRITQGNSPINPGQYVSKEYRFHDSKGWMLYGEFDSNCMPSYISLRYMRYPDTS